MLHGWIILDKPLGLGSTTAVSAVKRLLREAGEPKTKVGHGGTLDPLASGVLPIALGEATKLAGRMLDATKQYEFTIAFGDETDTLDTEGSAVARSDVRPTLADIEAVLPRFTGEIEQLPPVYSALKIDGKPAYARARAGEQVEVKPRRVTVSELDPPGRASAGWWRGRSERAWRRDPPPRLRRAVPSQRAREDLMKSPFPPRSPKEPTSARSPATSRGRLEPSVTFPILDAPAPVRSRWTQAISLDFLRKPLRRGASMGRLFR